MNKWQTQYETTSAWKGNHHWKIQKEVTTKPWFHDKPLNALEIRTLTRLRTGHGLCGVKKHLFKLQDTYFCMVCQEIDDLSHIMLRCKKYATTREKFNFHRDCDRLIDLLKKSELNDLKEMVKFYTAAALEF